MSDMTDLVCKCCSAPLDPAAAAGRVIRCKYCGTVFTLAKSGEPKAEAFLRTGEHELDICKFGEALAAYEKAAELDPEEPEAYFGMALAAFKVQYLKDEASDPPRLQPICHELSGKRFSEDKRYLRAIALATEEQRAQYAARAGEIDRIRGEFLSLKESGLDYDCFLCVKVTDGGKKTEDAARASELYFHLKELGYRPFYSEHEIKGRTGADYEALILYALRTSECMLIVCSDEEYLRTKWVKNEYTRFAAMIANEEKERDSIAFVFSGTPVERLPGREGKLQGIDLSRPDAYSRIAAFVERHTPAAQKKREEARLAEEREKEENRKHFTALEEELRRLRGQSLSEIAASEPFSWDDWKIEDGVLVGYSGKGTSVTIPQGIRAIGDGAFRNCRSLVSVTIGDGVVSVGEAAFGGCIGLVDVSAAESVKSIGAHAFEGCISLRRAKLGGAEEIPEGAFLGCTGLKGVAIPHGAKRIGAHAFEGCTALTGVTVPAGVKEIGSYAFRGCAGLRSAEIPASVHTLGRGVFADCGRISSVTIPKRLCGFASSNLKKIFTRPIKEIGFTFTK